MKKITNDRISQHSYAIITGASGGLGVSFMQACVDRGYNLFLIDLPERNLFNLCDFARRNFPVDVKYLEIDLAEDGAARKILDVVKNENMRVQMLINNAGMSQNDLFEDTDEDYLRKLIELNSIACVSLTKAILPELKKNRKSYIINISSLGSFFALPRKSCYAATKGFVRQFSQALRIEVKKYGVNVSVVCPGPVTTNLTNYMLHRQINWFSRNMMQSAKKVAEDGIKGALRGKGIIISGWLNKLLKLSASFVPDFLQGRITLYSMKQLKQEKKRVKEVIETELEEVTSITA